MTEMPEPDIEDPVQARFVANWIGNIAPSDLGIDRRGDKVTLPGLYGMLVDYTATLEAKAEVKKDEEEVEMVATALQGLRYSAPSLRTGTPATNIQDFHAARRFLREFNITPKDKTNG